MRNSTPENSQRVILLAGGLGTRLRGTLPPGVPKVLAPIAGHPVLAFQLAFLRLNGCRQVHLALSYQADTVLKTAHRYRPPGTSFSWHVEAAPQGTGGAVRTAFERCGWASALVVNADSFCLARLGMIARATTPIATHPAVMMVVRVEDASRFGAVDVEGSLVRRILEKQRAGPGYINAGVYWFDFTTWGGLSAGSRVSLERDLLPGLAARKQLRAVICDAPFHDIGTPDSLNAAEEFLRTHWVSAVHNSAPSYGVRGSVARRWLSAVANFPPRFEQGWATTKA